MVRLKPSFNALALGVLAILAGCGSPAPVAQIRGLYQSPVPQQPGKPVAIGLLPIIKAGTVAKTKLAAMSTRNLTANPLKVEIVGDSNSAGGYYSEGNTTARINTYERLSYYLNSPTDGFRTVKKPFASGIYVPFGPTPQGNLFDTVGNVRCQNSSNWIKVAPPASGNFVGGQTSFVKDPASAGYAAMRLDRRQSTFAQFDRKHDFEMTATRMKLFFSVGQTSAVQIDRNFGNTSMSTGAADATVAGNGFHGTITIRFYDLVGAASISSTTITPTTSSALGFNSWGGWTSDWISLPSSVTYPWVEIRVETAAGVRVAVDGAWFDDGSPKIQIFDNSYPGASMASISPKTFNQSGVLTDSSFVPRRQYIHSIRFLTKTNPLSPFTFDATSYSLAGAPTNYPLFSGGLDAVLDPLGANNLANDTPAKIKAMYMAMMAEFVIDNPNGVYIKAILLRGMGPLASLDSYVAGTATVGGVANQSWAMYRQALYDVQAAYPDHFVIMDVNQAIVNRFYNGVQPSATTLNTDLGFYSINDGLHTDPIWEDMMARATSLLLSGKL